MRDSIGAKNAMRQGVPRTGHGSWGQSLYHPVIRIVTPITQPIVESAFPFLPKLQQFGDNPIASPMHGPRHILPCKLLGDIFELFIQEGPVFDNLTLGRSMSFDLMSPGSTGKIDIGFVGPERFHCAFDSDLT